MFIHRDISFKNYQFSTIIEKCPIISQNKFFLSKTKEFHLENYLKNFCITFTVYIFMKNNTGLQNMRL